MLVPAFLLVAYLAARHPLFGFAIVAFAAPFDGYIRPLVIYKNFLASDVIAAVAMLSAIGRAQIRSERIPVLMFAFLSLAALVTLHEFSLLLTADWLDAADNLLRFAFLFAVFGVMATSLDARYVRFVAIALVLGGVARLGYEAFFYFRQSNFVLHWGNQFGNFTSNPNTLAGAAVPLVPLALSLAIDTRSSLLRIAYLTLDVLIASAIVLSFSKGAWVAVACGLTVWLWVNHRDIAWRRLTGWLAPAVVLVSLLVPAVRAIPPLMVDRWTSAASQISNDERLKYIEAATSMAMERPLTGVGLEQFAANYRERFGIRGGPEDPHNLYLLFAAELGWPGLFFYLLFATAVLTVAARAALFRAQSSSLASGICCGILALLVFQLFSSEPWSSRVSWIVFALPWPLLPESDPAIEPSNT